MIFNLDKKYLYFLIWSLSVSLMFFLLLQYQYKENDIKSSEIKLEGLYTDLKNIFDMENHADKLFVFLHPECSCSEATIDELNTLLAKANTRPDLFFIFSKPDGYESDINESRLWKMLSKIQKENFYIDEGAKFVSKYSILSSGTIIYFNNQKILYVGGITASRSHRGANIGENTLLKQIQDKNRDLVYFPAFGCSLY